MVLAWAVGYEYIRRNYYRTFLIVHVMCSTLAYVFAVLHSEQMRYLMIVPGAIWVYDHVIRFVCASGSPAAVLSAAVDAKTGVVALTISKPGLMFKAGSHVYLTVPSISSWESHPFSISSAPVTLGDEKSGTFTVHIQRSPQSNNSWTNELAMLASSVASGHVGSRSALEDLTVVVDGPYNSLSVSMNNKFENIVLVAGGIGITPLMSIFEETLNTIEHAVESSGPLGYLPKLHLVWIARNEDLLTRTFTKQVARAQQQDLLPYVDVHLFCTDKRKLRANSGDEETPSSSSVELVARKIAYQRPNIAEILDAIRMPMIDPKGPLRTWVSCCGPVSLIQAVQKASEERGFLFNSEGFLF